MLGGKIVTDPINLLDRKTDICLIISEASITQELDSYEGNLVILVSILV